MTKLNRHSTAGFTFIEVLVALLILVMTVIAAVNIMDTSVKSVRNAKEITTATWLLQNVMVELETKIETEGFDKGCEAKTEARFAAPYERFTWTTYCNEIDFSLSETAAQMMMSKEDDIEPTTQESQITKLILQKSGEYITKATRELHAEVTWMDGKRKKQIDLTTHAARYDLPLMPIGGQ